MWTGTSGQATLLWYYSRYCIIKSVLLVLLLTIHQRGDVHIHTVPLCIVMSQYRVCTVVVVFQGLSTCEVSMSSG